MQLAYPLLLGRQHPEGHPEYPRMGSFFAVQAGGGSYSEHPSPPSNNAAALFLETRANVPAAACAETMVRSIASTIRSLTALQASKVIYTMIYIPSYLNFKGTYQRLEMLFQRIEI